MKTKIRINKKLWIVLILVVTIQILFDPLSSLLDFCERAQAQIGLPYARRKWDTQGITHYKFDIRGYVPLVCIVGGSVEVENGVVVHTGPSTDALTRGEPDLDLGFTAMEDLPLCNYKNYTVSSFFDMLERQLAKYPNSVTRISFDPKYGFISDFGFGRSGGNGLLSPRISDCCGGFRSGIFRFWMSRAQQRHALRFYLSASLIVTSICQRDLRGSTLGSVR